MPRMENYWIFGFSWQTTKSEMYLEGKSFSEALIFASTNPKYDDRLFIKLWVQYPKIPSSEHVENMMCTQIVCFLFWHSGQFMYTTCSQHVLSFWNRYSMNNLLSYCGLVDARISASEKDLPVLINFTLLNCWWRMSSIRIQNCEWFGEFVESLTF